MFTENECMIGHHLEHHLQSLQGESSHSSVLTPTAGAAVSPGVSPSPRLAVMLSIFTHFAIAGWRQSALSLCCGGAYWYSSQWSIVNGTCAGLIAEAGATFAKEHVRAQRSQWGDAQTRKHVATLFFNIRHKWEPEAVSLRYRDQEQHTELCLLYFFFFYCVLQINV